MSALLDDDRAYVETLAEIKPRPIHDDAENERQTVLLEYLSFLENPTEEQRTIAEMLTILIEAYGKKFTFAKGEA